MPNHTTTTDGASRPYAGLLAIYPHLTSRDRQLLALLDAHRVLSTAQVQRLLFTALRTCQIRLALLRRLGLLERFRFARDGGGSYPWHWTLGLAGARLQAAANQRPATTPRGHAEQLLRLTIAGNLTHLVATNEFFVRLAHHARTQQGWKPTAFTLHHHQGQTIRQHTHPLPPVDDEAAACRSLLRWWAHYTQPTWDGRTPAQLTAEQNALSA
jgi:hypothetical protein